MLRPLYHRGTDPLPIVQEAGWAWAGTENVDSVGIRSSVRPSHSIVGIPIELSLPTFEYSDIERKDMYRIVTC